MILKDEKIFYIHIPKTGGSAIETFILKHFGYDVPNFTTFTQGFTLTQGRPIIKQEFVNICHLNYSIQIFAAKNSKIFIDDTWDIFTIVRNPYYRAASAIFFQPLLECIYHMHTLSTIEEKRKLFNKASHLFFNYDPTNRDWVGHRTPQYELLQKNEEEPRIKVFKYEQGLTNIVKSFLSYKIQFEGEIPRDNDKTIDFRIPKPNYKELFTKYFIEEVNKYYKKDFEIFKYEMLNPNNFPN